MKFRNIAPPPHQVTLFFSRRHFKADSSRLRGPRMLKPLSFIHDGGIGYHEPLQNDLKAQVLSEWYLSPAIHIPSPAPIPA